jgi:LmbE family N-acetylglucosaminyl deacetylase
MDRPCLMVVLAHPDDEAFGIGGTLARYAAEGCDVHLVCATRGEAGQIAEPELATVANLPAVRERELRCACEALGIRPPRFLDYVDGQLAIVHQGQAVGKVVRLIRELRPQVLLTFGPDGIYGHYDHIAVHRWATIACKLAAQGDCFPEQFQRGCQPHRVSRLYYQVLTQERVRATWPDDPEPAVMMDGVPFAVVGYPRGQITTVIDISRYLEAKLAGIQCHLTQVGRNSARVQRMRESADQPWVYEETFVLARSTASEAVGVETDLFAGLH